MVALPYLSLAKPTIRYCEPNLSGWVAQPANAGSSLLISLVGVYILSKKRHAFSLYLGIIAIVLGIASFAYYASFTFIGQLADLGSMYLLASLVIIVALRKYGLNRKISLSVLMAGAVIPLVLTAVLRTINGFNIGVPLFGLLLIVAVFLELRTARMEKLHLKYFLLTFLAFVIGYIFWWLDYKKLWCDPSTSHYINGHALWHLFNAIALVLLDYYYAQIAGTKKHQH